MAALADETFLIYLRADNASFPFAIPTSKQREAQAIAHAPLSSSYVLSNYPNMKRSSLLMRSSLLEQLMPLLPDPAP